MLVWESGRSWGGTAWVSEAETKGVCLAGGPSGARVHHMLGAADGAVRVRALDSLRRRGLPRCLARRAQAVRALPDPACTGKLKKCSHLCCLVTVRVGWWCGSDGDVFWCHGMVGHLLWCGWIPLHRSETWRLPQFKSCPNSHHPVQKGCFVQLTVVGPSLRRCPHCGAAVEHEHIEQVPPLPASA